MRIEDVMTRSVRTVSPETSLKEAAEILTELRISGLPVVADGKVVGVVSEADILTKERGEAPYRGGLLGLVFEDGQGRAKLLAKTVGEAMTSPAVTVRPQRPVAEAAATMIDRKINRLPVVDDKGTLLGIVSRADLVRAFVRSDDEIAREIREDVVLHTLWIAPEQLDVKVENGTVTLGGQVETRDDAELLPEFVRRVPGVVAVESHLTWEYDKPKREREREREPARH
jgi:CBS domain-containing protein